MPPPLCSSSTRRPAQRCITNDIQGNSDIGIYFCADGGKVAKSRVSDRTSIADCNAFGWDIGIGDWGSNNTVNNNQVRGFDDPYDGVIGNRNKVQKAKP